MTSSANAEWAYFHLKHGIDELKKQIRRNKMLGVDKDAVFAANESLQNTIDFIEYNMREMEITGGNGDE